VIARGAAIAVALVALSLAWYGLMAFVSAHGNVQFYELGEHAGWFGYCVVCYAACWGCDRVLRARRWLAFAASYVVASVATVVLAAAVRLLVGRWLGWGDLLFNVPLVLMMFHSAIAGTYFAVRHIHAAVARAAAERAAAQAELRRLQHQVDPHFLFNNLNILTALIKQSPDDAEQFGYHLARLYRYLLRHNQAAWVTLADELGFVDSYLHVLEARFGRAYRMTRSLPAELPYFVVPGALQEILGNVVKHNDASAGEPVEIGLRLDGETLIAENTMREKRVATAASGHGLAMLGERYRLQLGRSITWYVRDGRFCVALPLVSAL
jgi:two-component system LytT family sensor kinase